MAYSDELFSEQLDQVKNQFQDLSTTLEEVCENLKESGSPPPSEILEEINSAIESFEELKSYVTKWAQDVQMPDTEAQELDSLKAITTFSQDIVAHQNDVQDEKILEYINRARSIKYAKEGESFPPPDDFLRKLDKLEKRVSTPPISDEDQNDRTQILENRHPINYLLRLLEPGDELNIESRGRALNIIGQEYGDAFMGAASIPGSLVLPKISDKKDSQPPPPDVKEKSEESKPESADNLPVDGQAEVQPEEIPEEPPAITTQEKPEESKPEGADNLPIGGQVPIEVEVKKEKTESKDVPDKDGITELKQEIDPDLPDKEVPVKLGFNASETAQSIASSLLKSSESKFKRGFPDLFWALIQEKRLSLAYWLARHVESKELDLPFTLPSYFVEALIHGLAVQNNAGSSASCLADIYNQEKFEFLESEEAGYKESIRLLIVSGTLRPSLLAPHTGAYTFLKSLTSLPGLDAFFAIGQAVEKFAEQGSPIITDNLTDAKDDQRWQGELDNLIEEAKVWLERAPKMAMKNNILNKIWRDYVKEGNLVHNLVSPVAEDKNQQVKDVSAMISKLNNIRTFAQEKATQAAGKRFDYRPRLLENGIKKAVDFASRWVKLYDQRPKQDYRTDLSRTLRLRDEIQQHADTAREQLNAFAEQHKDFKPILASVEISQHVLKAITGLFNGESLSTEDDERVLRSAELLKIPNLELTEKWTPTEEALDNLGGHLVEHIALPKSDRTWEKALKKQTEHHNHWATKHILDMMTDIEDNKTISKLQEKRQEQISKCITALKTNIEATKKKIGNTVLYDVLTDQVQSTFGQQIEGIDPNKVLNFGLEHYRLKAIRNKIEQIKEDRIKECKKRLAGLSMSKDDRQKIDVVLDRGDVGTAEGFIAIFKKDGQLSDHDEDNWVDQFQEFFPNAVQEIEELSKETRPKNIISSVKNGQSMGILNMDKMSDYQREEAADVLTAWYELKRLRGDKFLERYHEETNKILGWLGFDTQNIDLPELSSGRVWIPLTATVSSRCPIPAFGSRSKGQYRLMCVWTQPDEDEILDWIDHGAQGQSIIVFYFGRLTIRNRRDLAHAARAYSRPFLLIDENQLLFLCNERGARLPTLFDCAMPFACINPYTPYSRGNVPPEMFFGREQETTDLMDLDGSCFIYGGRQLGKTALLQHVERRFENESDNQKAIFLDLKAHGIPIRRPMEALWPVLRKCLWDKGIIPKKQTSLVPEVILNRIKGWIEAQPNRRVLLMLDESDDFLENDANQNFGYVLQLTNLMDQTEHQFKLVFAGLHNVQRFRAIPNQPLVRKSISIGPLTPRAARDLIVKPLRTLGYRFDDPSLVEMILFHMNSYPNLIQLFCDELLKYFRKTPFSARQTPPYGISEKHIEEVYQSQDLRAKIIERFNWTLNLDKRYSFIAYRIAYEIRSGVREKGFEVDWIADEARRYWPEGFVETSLNDEIRGLLDEMIGLGILTKIENRYWLRSPNVLRLLGTDDEIERELTKITEYVPSPEFDPNSFRRSLNVKNLKGRSSFTTAQESDILKSENDIRLIFGSEGLGIKRVSEDAKIAVEDYAGHVHLLKFGIKSSKQLRSWLQECIGNTEEGYVVPIIPLEKAGSEPKNLIEWIETAQDIVNRRHSEKRPIRILFLVPPEAAQIWVRIPKKKREELTAAGGRELKLKRWNETGLRHWLDDHDIAPNTDAQRKEILDATGGWPIFMEDFEELCLDKAMHWEDAIKQIREVQQNIGDNLRQKFCEKFGLIQMDRADHVWTTLCKWCPIEFSELQGEIEDMPPENILQIVDYFDCLNLLKSKNKDQICPEPVAAAMTAGR